MFQKQKELQRETSKNAKQATGAGGTFLEYFLTILFSHWFSELYAGFGYLAIWIVYLNFSLELCCRLHSV